MENQNSKRNYIRRKKTYNKSCTLVRQTLELINLVKNTKMPPIELDQLAKQHADRVEAVCWDPRTKISDDLYQQLVIKKTRELCTLLINKYAPQVNTINLLIKMHGTKLLQNKIADNQSNIISDSSTNPLPLPVFKIDDTNNSPVNIIIKENDKKEDNENDTENKPFQLTEDFQIIQPPRPESPFNCPNLFIHEPEKDPMKNEFDMLHQPTETNQFYQSFSIDFPFPLTM